MCLPVCLGSVAPQAALGVLVWKHLGNKRERWVVRWNCISFYWFHWFQEKLRYCAKHQENWRRQSVYPLWHTLNWNQQKNNMFYHQLYCFCKHLLTLTSMPATPYERVEVGVSKKNFKSSRTLQKHLYGTFHKSFIGNRSHVSWTDMKGLPSKDSVTRFTTLWNTLKDIPTWAKEHSIQTETIICLLEKDCILLPLL